MMTKLLPRWWAALCALWLLGACLSAAAGESGRAYEAPLPAQLATDPDLCAYVPCRAVMPQAGRFSLRKGHPPYVEAYRSKEDQRDGEKGRKGEERHDHEEEGTLVGYIFLSTDIVDIPGYSGQPIVTLIGMDMQGRITGTQVLRHAEPILLLGIPESDLIDFIRQYVGKYVGQKIAIGARRGTGEAIGVDAISGATVTVIAENLVIMKSAMEIAKQVGIVKPTLRPQARFIDLEPPNWATLRKEGSVQRLTVRAQDVGKPASPRPYVDLYFGYLNAPAVGKAILGEGGYRRLMSELEEGEHAIFLVSDGTESFKGSGFVRGGIFDRIQVSQETDTFTFRDRDYQNLYDVRASDAPSFHESAIFIIRSKSFSPAYPWNLAFLANKVDTRTGVRTFLTFEEEYWLAGRHIVGGRPAYERPAAAWTVIWRSRAVEIGLFALLLLSAGALYASRDWLVRRANRKDKRWVSWPKYALWIVSIGFAGFYLMAQPSITQVLTWFHAILFKWEWTLFLSDPFLFLFWIFIIATVFFWGRGMFCGWLCPYGALTETAFRVAGFLGLKRFQFQLPPRIHEKLKWVKYFVFAGLLGVSFYSVGAAEKLAEIEPFKTTFLIGVWNRSWPFAAFWLVLFGLALFIERPFCKYLCPLGASLGVPSTFRWWGLRRKQECSTCHACAKACDSLAIDAKGRIDQRECLLCLNCMVFYYDAHACPPLAKERKQRAKAGLALTRISKDGYYIPIKTEAAPPRPVAAQAPKIGLLRWLRRELIDHLIPWNREFLKHPVLLRAAGVGLAMLVTWVWLLGASGRLGAGIVLGWWLAWSAYELVIRLQCKPWVKEGPWWGHTLRPATWPDMAAYVAMKNLLIGAALFLLMRGTGLLDFLHALPGLRWLY
ncbi:MAG TPA: 4Fe-4S binding protein [Steroidobacter sp.]|nr:4Fe-4S binding protein [Steroidobacter sp.]